MKSPCAHRPAAPAGAPYSRSRPNRETGIPSVPVSRFPANRESGIAGEIPPKTGKRGIRCPIPSPEGILTVPQWNLVVDVPWHQSFKLGRLGHDRPKSPSHSPPSPRPSPPSTGPWQFKKNVRGLGGRNLNLIESAFEGLKAASGQPGTRIVPRCSVSGQVL